MTCGQRGPLDGNLPCDNPHEHKGGGKGCTYTASDAPDRHDLTEARDD